MLVTVTRNAQITIPKEIREKLNIKVGDRVKMYLEGDKIIVKKFEDVLEEEDFLPKGFEDILSKIRKDSRNRFRRIGVIP